MELSGRSMGRAAAASNPAPRFRLSPGYFAGARPSLQSSRKRIRLPSTPIFRSVIDPGAASGCFVWASRDLSKRLNSTENSRGIDRARVRRWGRKTARGWRSFRIASMSIARLRLAGLVTQFFRCPTRMDAALIGSFRPERGCAFTHPLEPLFVCDVSFLTDDKTSHELPTE